MNDYESLKRAVFGSYAVFAVTQCTNHLSHSHTSPPLRSLFFIISLTPSDYYHY